MSNALLESATNNPSSDRQNSWAKAYLYPLVVFLVINSILVAGLGYLQQAATVGFRTIGQATLLLLVMLLFCFTSKALLRSGLKRRGRDFSPRERSILRIIGISLIALSLLNVIGSVFSVLVQQY